MQRLHNLSDSFPSSSLISVNWHLWPRCIHRCKFCFGKFEEIKNVLKKEEAMKIPEILKEVGTQKLSFSGGEPLLCPYLGDLIKETKQLGITTMLITSGTLLDEDFLYLYGDYIDWIALSIDSSKEVIQQRLGRGTGNHIRKTKEVARLIHEKRIKLKINTVVTDLSWEEDMSNLISELAPERWKIFQVLQIAGQNNNSVEKLLISTEKFNHFKETHYHLHPIYESNEDMKGSYIMLDALGRFFQNTNGYLEYSKPILKINPIEALNQVGWNYWKFLKRGGLYNWSKRKRGVY